MNTFQSFVAMLVSVGAKAVLSVLSFTVTKFKDGEAKVYRLNSQAELKENVERIGTKDTTFRVSAPKENTQACAVARKIADTVASAHEGLVVTEQEYKDKLQFTVGRPTTASDLAGLLG